MFVTIFFSLMMSIEVNDSEIEVVSGRGETLSASLHQLD
jgi:hypothetical protein